MNHQSQLGSIDMIPFTIIISQCVKTVIDCIRGLGREDENMELEQDKLEIDFLQGNEIPDVLVELTNKKAGLLMSWMIGNRSQMGAVTIMYRGEFIAWAAYLDEKPIYSVGTFVAEDYRQCGLGKLAMHKMIEIIKSECPNAYVRCGGSKYSEFNYTYEKQILACGLKPANIWHPYPEVNEAA